MKVLSGSRGLVMQSVDDDVLIVASGRVSSVSYTAGREFRVREPRSASIRSRKAYETNEHRENHNPIIMKTT